MEPVQQPMPSTVQPTSPVAPVPETPVPHEVLKKKSNTSWILGILIFGLLLLSGYLYYQNMQLQEELEMVMLNGAMVSNVSDDSLALTKEPIVNAGNITTPTPDPTAGWETYSGNQFLYSNNTYGGYKFEYPDSCTVLNSVGGAGRSALNCQLLDSTDVSITVNAGGHGLGNVTVLTNEENRTYPAGLLEVTLWKIDFDNSLLGVYWFKKTPLLEQSPIFGFEVFSDSYENEEEVDELMDQILSTFEFVE